MSINKLFHLGPLYCTECDDTTIHSLSIEHPFFGVGPETPETIWMDFIKKSRVICDRCGNKTKMTPKTKELFRKLKRAKLIDIDDVADFQKRIKEVISQKIGSDSLNDDGIQETVDYFYQKYREYNISREWFESYVFIMCYDVLKESAFTEYLYR